jgi:hypothetical protein
LRESWEKKYNDPKNGNEGPLSYIQGVDDAIIMGLYNYEYL